MLYKITEEQIFCKDYGWHKGRFHFAFGDYEDAHNLGYGVLSALNDFVVQPKSGFDTHPHSEMEIISYCVAGMLTHRDDMGNATQLKQRDSQYTCSGSGINHSEMNDDEKEPLRFLQIWITPMKKGLSPMYEIRRNQPEAGRGHFHHIASGEKRKGVLRIMQDANIVAAHLEEGQYTRYTNDDDRQSYVYCLEGNMSVNGFLMKAYDAMKVWRKETIHFHAREHAHVLIVEMARG